MADVEVFPLLDAEGSFTTYDDAFPALGRSGVWVVPVRAFLVRADATSILVDTGVGPPGGGAFLPERQGWLLQELELVGSTQDEVEIVFLTHLHVDHVGWCGSFPNARYVAHCDDWAHFSSRGDAYMERTLEPLRAEGSFELLDGGGAVTPGVVAIPTPGHTPGHMSLRVGDDLLVLGDVCVDESQVVDPGLVYVYDVDGEQAAATRREVLALAADEGLLVAAPHLPGNGLGHVAREGEGFRWDPSK